MRVTEDLYPAGLWQDRHAHAETGFSIVLAGTLRERVGRAEEIARPLSIVTKPGGTEHSDLFGTTEVRLVRIMLTEAEAAHMTPWASSLASWRWSHAGPATRAFLRVACVCRVTRVTPEEQGLERAVWDALAALSANAASPTPSDPPRWLSIIREALDDSPEPPRLSSLAALADVHPVYLARRFRGFYGCSVSGYVHRLRVQRAAHLIARTPQPLSRISSEAGFTDQAHMCRIFRRATGLTPTQFRNVIGQVSTVQDDVA